MQWQCHAGFIEQFHHCRDSKNKGRPCYNTGETMNKIYVIEQAADVFNTVKDCLKEENIEYLSFQRIGDALSSSELPALIILLCPNNLTEIGKVMAQIRDNQSFVRVPRILILPLDSTIDRQALGEFDVQEIFRIPIERLKFQATISKFLMQAPRRVFRILVTILRTGDKIRYSGVSVDFSESGMAFECNSDFIVGEELQISFVNPKNRSRMLLSAVVARKTATPTGSSAFYGVAFRRLADIDRMALANFISGVA